MRYAMVMPWQVADVLNSTPQKISVSIKSITKREKEMLIGSVLSYFDNNPLSTNLSDKLKISFDSNTCFTVDNYLRKKGIADVADCTNIPMRWHVSMTTFWDMPNRQNYQHEDCETFEFYGTIFPATDLFKSERERIHMRQKLEYMDIPDGNKNKKVYKNTKFVFTAIGAN